MGEDWSLRKLRVRDTGGVQPPRPDPSVIEVQQRQFGDVRWLPEAGAALDQLRAANREELFLAQSDSLQTGPQRFRPEI